MNSMTKTLLLTILIALVATPAFALNPTTTGRIAVTPTDTAIWVSAYYTEDTNNNNHVEITWKLSSNPVWPAPQFTSPLHPASPYSQKITGLTNGTEYDVRVDFVDAADGVTGTDPQYAYRVIPSTMMHNSENATSGTMKWSPNGWGIPGGQYGQFECSTCHTTSTTNIMRVWTTVATPNGMYWGSTNRSKLPANFQSRTLANGFGDDTGGHTTSTKICEVCHSQTDYHRYDTTGQSGGTGHYNNNDCTSACHKHSGGFKGAGGACNACHGATPSMFWSTNIAGSYPGNAPGAHATHFGLDSWYTVAYDDTNLSTASYYRFQCNKCHGADHSSSPTPNITLASTNAPRSNGGTYSNVTNTCSTVYCHGSALTSGTNTSPTWSATLACGACHGATWTTTPTTGAHVRHARNDLYAGGTKQGVGVACTECHGTNAGGIPHVDGNVSWWLTTGSARFGASATYRTTAWGSTGAEAPSGSYGQCNNIYCHSTAQGNPPSNPVTYTPIAWDGTTTCSSCHPNQTSAWTGSHQQHTDPAQYNIACSVCHSARGSETTYHANRSIDWNFSGLAAGGTYNGTTTPGDSYNTCSTVYCHSNGAGSYVAVPRWGSLNTGACGTCHGANNATPPASTPHARHVGDTPGYRYDCYKCHSTVITDTADSTVVPSIASYTLHVNNARNVAFDTWNSIGAFSSPSASCLSTYCHSQGTGGTAQTGDNRALSWRTMNWSGTSTCGSCHGGDATGQPQYANDSPKKNSHTAHRVWNTVVSCSACHYATTNTNTSITGPANHVDKAYTLSSYDGAQRAWASLARISSYTYAVNGGTCTVNCHAGLTPKWGTIGFGSGTQLDWNCIACHSSSFPKRLGGMGTIRMVWGTFGDFNMAVTNVSRHLRGATTIYKWDCIVCHQEGQAGGWNTGGVDWGYHNDGWGTPGGRINLRDVDNPATGWAINNRNWTTTDYTNMDQFCLNCHDADGANAISVNATNNGLDLTVGGARRLTPFNTTDTSGGYVRASTNGPFNRTRVINLKDKFFIGSQPAGINYNGNPSQHAVIGRRYSTVWAAWGQAAWGSTYVLKKSNARMNVARETAVLSCADCHVIDSGVYGNAHGGRTGNFYMMWATQADRMCWRCHNQYVYQSATGPAGVSQMDHWNIDGNIGGTETAYGLANANWPCMACHASYSGWTTATRVASYGGIHGSWNTFASWYTNAAGTGAVLNYRFSPGTYFKTNPPGGVNGAWGSGGQFQCYFWTAAQKFTNCSSHDGSGPANAPDTGSLNYSRRVNY